MSRTLQLAHSLAPGLIELRRELHRFPEMGLDLPRTQRAVLDALEGLELEITLGKKLSSVVAVLRGGAAPSDGPRPAVLLRGDMDGLPVTEEVDVDYRSTTDGAMHACGHDLHVAALVGAVRVLHEMRDELAGDVVFMFQPGEEGPGGAEAMIREGLLTASGSRVSAAYTLHVFSSEHPLGMWFGRPGPMMAAADEMSVRVLGQGGHPSQPHRAKDPIPAMCQMVVGLQNLVTRSFDVFDPIVVTVGKVAAGTKENIIPDDAFFVATIRSLSPEARNRAHERIPQLVRGLARAHGLEVEIDYRLAYPITCNDPQEFDFARQTAVDLFGADRWTDQLHPELGSEDMSFVLEEVPGAYLNVSACATGDHRLAEDNHSPRAAFDDAVVPDAAAWLAEVARRRLEAHA
jgi:hippurate hydrolase